VGSNSDQQTSTAVDGDVEEIRQLAEAYVHAADTGDSHGLTELFLPEGRLTTWPPDGSPGTPHYGIESIGSVPTTLALRYERSVHRLGELHVVVSDDGRTALGNLDCVAELTADGVTRVLTIRYEDAYRRDGEGRWRFVTRDVRIQSVEQRPA
jgi:ketosteroid isomerase-like protein